MALNVASLNVHGLRAFRKQNAVLKELKTYDVDVAAIEETHFVSASDARVLARGYSVVSAYGTTHSRGVSLLVKSVLQPRLNVFHQDAAGRLIVVDVAIKSYNFRVIAIYAPNEPGKRVDFFREIEPFLNYSGRLVLMGDWNAILNPNIDRPGRGDSAGGGMFEPSLVDFMERSDLVDRFRVDHPDEKVWTWGNSSSSNPLASYLDRVLVRRADVDFVTSPTFIWLGVQGVDHKLVKARILLSDRPSLAGYWKFNLSHYERKDFRDALDEFLRGKLEGR